MADFTINIGADRATENNVIGDNVSPGNLLYLSDDEKYYLASSLAKETSTTELRIALESGVVDDEIKMLAFGYYEFGPASLTAGAKHYVDAAEGVISVGASVANGNVCRYVGTAYNDSVFLFNPDQTYVADNGFTVNDIAIQSQIPSHTHSESDISDLDKYTTLEVDALIDGATDKHFEHTQTPASVSWVIAHNLGKRPSVTVQDESGNDVEGAITFTDENNLTISFNTAFAGKAYLN